MAIKIPEGMPRNTKPPAGSGWTCGQQTLERDRMEYESNKSTPWRHVYGSFHAGEWEVLEYKGEPFQFKVHDEVGCEHKPKEYFGLNERYMYCEKCGDKL